jgi:hypothetical protein
MEHFVEGSLQFLYRVGVHIAADTHLSVSLGLVPRHRVERGELGRFSFKYASVKLHAPYRSKAAWNLAGSTARRSPVFSFVTYIPDVSDRRRFFLAGCCRPARWMKLLLGLGVIIASLLSRGFRVRCSAPAFFCLGRTRPSWCKCRSQPGVSRCHISPPGAELRAAASESTVRAGCAGGSGGFQSACFRRASSLRSSAISAGSASVRDWLCSSKVSSW